VIERGAEVQKLAINKVKFWPRACLFLLI